MQTSVQHDEKQILRERLRLYQSSLEGFQGFIYTRNQHGDLLFVGQEVRAVLGMTPEELVGQSCAGCFTVPDKKRAKEGLLPANHQEKDDDAAIYEVNHQSGTPRILWIHEKDEKSVLGQDIIRGTVRDITEIFQWQRALQESDKRYRNLLEQLLVGIVILDNQRRTIRYVSPTITRVLDLTLEEAQGMTPKELLSHCAPAEDSQVVEQTLDRLGRLREEGFNKAYDTEFCYQRQNGGQRWLLHTDYPVSSPDGDNEVHWVFQDITLRKQAETGYREILLKLNQPHRTELLGKLMSGIANQFNNMIGVFSGNITYLQDKAGIEQTMASAEVEKCCRDINETLLQLQKFAGLLSGFVTQSDLQASPLNLNDVANEAIDLLQRSFERPVLLESQFATDLCPIMADKESIKQVLVALSLHIYESMAGLKDGRVIFQTYNKMDELRLVDNKKVDSWTCLALVDNGVGITERMQRAWTDPILADEKELPFVLAGHVIRQFHGEIKVESTEEGLNRLVLMFPSFATENLVDGHTAEKERVPTVLVVDDEEYVCKMLDRILTSLNYQAVLVASGKEALRLFEEDSRQFDLVILDLMMPEMGGAELFVKLREVAPDTKIMISSGYGMDPKTQELLAKGAVGFVQKPYTLADISKAIIEAVESYDG